MDALTRTVIDSEHYVARYVRGGLSDQQRAAFEEYCLLHAEVAEQVATDRVLVRGLRDLDGARTSRAAQPWMRFAAAAGIAAVIVAAGTWGYFRAGMTTPVALYAAADALPGKLQRRLSAPLRVVLQRGTLQTLDARPPRDVLRLDIVMDPATTALSANVTLIEHTADGEIERGRVSQPLSILDDDRIVPVVVNVSATKSSRLRLDVEVDGMRRSFELRVLR